MERDLPQPVDAHVRETESELRPRLTLQLCAKLPAVQCLLFGCESEVATGGSGSGVTVRVGVSSGHFQPTTGLSRRRSEAIAAQPADTNCRDVSSLRLEWSYHPEV